MRTLFLSDAHLRHPDDANYRRLMSFLDAQRGRLDRLCLLGDIFEFWTGYRHVAFCAYIPFLERIRRLKEEGTRIYYVEGNHDFDLGPLWQELTEGRLYPDGVRLEDPSGDIFMSHGDLVNSDDRGYRLLRACFRSPAVKVLKGIIPPDLTWSIADWAGRQSKNHHRPTDPKKLETLLRSHAAPWFDRGCRAVVTGHYHCPLLLQAEGGKTILSLGDWITQNSYALLEDGELKLLSYP